MFYDTLLTHMVLPKLNELEIPERISIANFMPELLQQDGCNWGMELLAVNGGLSNA